MRYKYVHELEEIVYNIDQIFETIYKSKTPKDDPRLSIIELTKMVSKYVKENGIEKLDTMDKFFDDFTDPKNYDIRIIKGKVEIIIDKVLLDDFHKEMELAVGAVVADKFKKEISEFITKTYTLAQKVIIDKLPKKISTDFEMIDRQTIKYLNKNTLFWIGDTYNRTLSKTINNNIKSAIIRGEGRKEASKILKEALKDRFNKPDSYYNVVASAVMNRTRNYGRINSFVKADIEKYEFIAVMDQRTSSICRSLNGKIFEVSVAREIIEEVEQAENPEDLKKIQPWGYINKDNDLIVNGKVQKIDVSNLQSIGLIMPPLHARCYDKITEVYTNEGWKFFKDLNKNELILSLNPENFDLEWLKPIEYIEYLYDGQMLSYQKNNFDLVVTPEHKMFYQKRWNKRTKKNIWEFIEAKNLPTEATVYRSSKWQGIDKKTININGLELDTELFCKFLGIYLAEGSYTRNNKRGNEIKISQEKEDNRIKIYENLKELPCKVSTNKQGVFVWNKELHKYVSQFGYSSELYIPGEIKELSNKYIRIFLDWFCLGDGHIKKGKVWKDYKFKDSKTYFTSSKKLNDDLGELILKVGHYPSFSFENRKGRMQKFKNGTYEIKTDLYVIRENTQIKSELNGENGKTEIIDYNDYVYCLQLPKFHTMYVRRNGKCVWCGNCRSLVVPVF